MHTLPDLVRNVCFSVPKNPLTIILSLCYVNQPLNVRHAEVAQLVEQRPEKPRVRSSILRLGTNKPTYN